LAADFQKNYCINATCFENLHSVDIKSFNASKMDKLLLASATIFHLGGRYTRTGNMDIQYAVNSGGPKYTSVVGITYDADTDRYESVMPHPWSVENIKGPDMALYKASRFNNGGYDGFNYTLPLTGNGWYGLVLHIASQYDDGQYLFEVRLNGHSILKNYNPYSTRKCGEFPRLYQVCDTVVYFSVCNGGLYWNGGRTEIAGNQALLEFREYSYVEAVLLVKGVAAARKIVIFDTTIFQKKITQKSGIRSGILKYFFYNPE
jgi:Malectin domain